MTKKQAKSTKKSALKLKAVDPKAQFAGFKKFIKDQGLIGMAIGLILGTASGDLVKSLINNIIMPPLGFFLGSAEGLKGVVWNMGKTPAGKEAVLSYGAFLNDVINFLVIAFVVYFVLLFVEKLFTDDDIEAEAEEAAKK
jgi:large conductance mechanosensitive channel protein